jgi:hypothetical protein
MKKVVLMQTENFVPIVSCNNFNSHVAHQIKAQPQRITEHVSYEMTNKSIGIQPGKGNTNLYEYDNVEYERGSGTDCDPDTSTYII